MPNLHITLLALALLLLGIDQTRMAIVDCRNINAVKGQLAAPDFRLFRFQWVTYTTIALEIFGFGLAFWWLGWGTAIVLLSQVWFNLLAGAQLEPESKTPIQDFGISDRALILAADGLGLLLTGLWIVGIAPLGMAIGLLVMVVIYGLLKYIFVSNNE
jgi:hypothetical protein